MSDHDLSEGASSRPPATCALATGIVQAAVADAERIRLDAIRAGEQMSEEIIKSARAQAERILVEARHEAQRIVADARLQASGVGGHDHRTPEITLETLRSELAGVVRQLRPGLEAPGAAGPDVDRSARPQEAAPRQPVRESDPGHLPRNGRGGLHAPPEQQGTQNGSAWEPPEWMSSDS